MPTAVCTQPVEIYDEDLRGLYRPGQQLDGPQAQIALARYPGYFRPGVAPATQEKGE